MKYSREIFCKEFLNILFLISKYFWFSTVSVKSTRYQSAETNVISVWMWSMKLKVAQKVAAGSIGNTNSQMKGLKRRTKIGTGNRVSPRTKRWRKVRTWSIWTWSNRSKTNTSTHLPAQKEPGAQHHHSQVRQKQRAGLPQTQQWDQRQQAPAKGHHQHQGLQEPGEDHPLGQQRAQRHPAPA